MASWNPPVLSEEEISSSTILRNKNEDEREPESISTVVEEATGATITTAPEGVSEVETQPQEEQQETPAPEAETQAALEDAEDDIPLTPIEEELEEAEIEMSPPVTAPEVKRMPASWENSRTKVLPTISTKRKKKLSTINMNYDANDMLRLSDNLDEEEEDDDIFDESEQLAPISNEVPKALTEAEMPDSGKMITLSREEKDIFSYFMPIDGMETAICKALYNTKNYLQGKVDKGGHIIVQGIQGSGKTMLATSMVKVLQSQISLPAGSVGKVDGDKLNGKDIGKLFSKIPGGCLIIEQAGDINRETAIRLSLMMDNDKTGILIILEDSKKGIERLLRTSAELEREFTEKIVIPPFTIDELVEFAKKYADDCECVIDEMGILALYDRINIIQSLDHPTAITEVKEIMDEAMENADKGGKKGPFGMFGAKKYNDKGYMIIREKNFRV